MPKCQKCTIDHSSDCIFILKRCRHNFCHECLHNYVKDNLSVKIKCPLQYCQQTIPDQVIRKCLSNEQIQIYENSSMLASSNNFRKCLTKDCPKIVSILSDDAIFQCNYCNQSSCFKCNKRHKQNECGRNYLDENAINESAKEAMKKRRKEALEELASSDDYIAYPEAFTCGNCCNFILPRNGIMLRECFHSFCKNCFETYIRNVNNVNKLTCLGCKMNIDDRDVIKGIGTIPLKNMIRDFMIPKLFSCKFPNCDGLWDTNYSRSTYRCLKCYHVNCLDCQAIHEGMTCSQYRQTKEYKFEQAMKDVTKNGVVCKCKKILIQTGGCGALRCSNCFHHICVFTGKYAGDRGPDSCQCRDGNRCHPRCVGMRCVPDGPTLPI